jgi:hypothetical protein
MDSKKTKSKQQFLKGYYKIQNPAKYLCKKKDYCIYRSSWEKSFMHHLDNDDNIIGWCSECVVIPYYFNGKQRRYYTDFLVVDKDKRKIIVEIKPYRQTIPPRNSKNKSKKTFLYENKEYYKNMAKWEAAKKYCDKRGMEFKVLTEKNIRL